MLRGKERICFCASITISLLWGTANRCLYFSTKSYQNNVMVFCSMILRSMRWRTSKSIGIGSRLPGNSGLDLMGYYIQFHSYIPWLINSPIFLSLSFFIPFQVVKKGEKWGDSWLFSSLCLFFWMTCRQRCMNRLRDLKNGNLWDCHNGRFYRKREACCR